MMCKIGQIRDVCEMLLKRMDDNKTMNLEGIRLGKEDLEQIDKIYIVASGNDYNTGRVGKCAIEALVKMPVSVEVASEFTDNISLVGEKTLVIALSHFGETQDLIDVVSKAKEKNARILAITSTKDTTISEMADDVFYTYTAEIDTMNHAAVYITQLVALYMIALHCARLKEVIAYRQYRELIDQIENLTIAMQEAVEEIEEMVKVAHELEGEETILCIGRGLDYISAMKLAFELEEHATRHAEAFLAGELKHGLLGLVREAAPVVAFITQDELADKMLLDLQIIKDKGAKIIVIVKTDMPNIKEVADYSIELPRANDLLMPILAALPIQVLSYYNENLGK